MGEIGGLMSYEGYDEYLCENGHHWVRDCSQDSGKCSICRGGPVWCHSVDQTNGMMDKYDDPDGATRPARLRVVRHEVFEAKRPIFAIPRKGRLKA
jgi:hypothetical protein